MTSSRLGHSVTKTKYSKIVFGLLLPTAFFLSVFMVRAARDERAQ